jgi:hypothetical protein
MLTTLAAIRPVGVSIQGVVGGCAFSVEVASGVVGCSMTGWYGGLCLLAFRKQT